MASKCINDCKWVFLTFGIVNVGRVWWHFGNLKYYQLSKPVHETKEPHHTGFCFLNILKFCICYYSWNVYNIFPAFLMFTWFLSNFFHILKIFGEFKKRLLPASKIIILDPFWYLNFIWDFLTFQSSLLRQKQK